MLWDCLVMQNKDYKTISWALGTKTEAQCLARAMRMQSMNAVVAPLEEAISYDDSHNSFTAGSVIKMSQPCSRGDILVKEQQDLFKYS